MHSLRALMAKFSSRQLPTEICETSSNTPRQCPVFRRFQSVPSVYQPAFK